ncbi:MAG TPA: hypothetical protein VGM60_24770 [Pseudonocardia sp.]|jgi:hypothetical protein|uniref:hypothetical protein n=1 Tax=Pseudonocardia sp. TaxID=60912 RepID=UPI002F3EF040
MTTTPDSWSTGLLTALLRHLSESVRGLLPSGLALMTAGLEVALVRRGPDGAPRTVRRFSAQPPTSRATPPSELAVLLLAQLQREVGRHLGRPWPTNSDGVALQPSAEHTGNSLRLRLVPGGTRADSPVIELAPFVLPTTPGRGATGQDR